MSIWFDFFSIRLYIGICFNFRFVSNFRYANSAQGGTTAGCPGGPVKVSFVSLPKPVQPVQQQTAAAVGQGTLEATEATTAVTVTGSSAPAQGDLLRGIVNLLDAA